MKPPFLGAFFMGAWIFGALFFAVGIAAGAGVFDRRGRLASAVVVLLLVVLAFAPGARLWAAVNLWGPLIFAKWPALAGAAIGAAVAFYAGEKTGHKNN